MNGEWEDVSSGAAGSPAAAFLEGNGLAKYARKIIEATDAESMEDLRMIDAAMVEDVIRDADIKLVSAKKLRVALAELRGEAPAAAPQPPAAGSSEPQAGGAGAPGPSGQAGVPAPESGGPTSAAPAAETAAAPPLQECIAVCIDRSGSMGAPFAEVTLNVVKGAVTQRTRMEAVKAMFYAFRDRVESVGRGGHEMGLIQFDNAIERMLDLTPRLDRFEAVVDDLEKRGQTAIYSAVVEAARMLQSRFREDSKVDLRVLVLTDGQSNSGVPPQEALAAVNEIGAVVDAIVVGDRPDSNLRKIVSTTGGECYQISDLGEGFELLEAEGVVSLKARRGGAEKPAFERRAEVDFGTISEKVMTTGSKVKRAPVVSEALAKKRVVSATAMDEDAVKASSGGGGASVRRILMELKQVASGAAGVWMHSGEGVHVFPASDSAHFWRALIEGPQGSPFEGGVFALNVVIPGNYPFSPPGITFETPVYHCNVSDSGKICLSILQESWSPSLSVPKCLEAIRIMLKNPDTDNSLRQWIAELTLAHRNSSGADTRYYDKACECTRQDASKSVDEWKREWGC